MKGVPALLLMTACASGAPNGAQDTAGTTAPAVASTPVRKLLEMQQSGWAEATVHIADDSAALVSAWRRSYANMSDVPPLPAVDFSAERVAFVAAGTRPSGGFVLSLESNRMRGDTVEVRVKLQTPGEGCGAIAALTQPLLVLAIPRAGTPQITVAERRGPSC